MAAILQYIYVITNSGIIVEIRKQFAISLGIFWNESLRYQYLYKTLICLVLKNVFYLTGFTINLRLIFSTRSAKRMVRVIQSVVKRKN